MIYDFMKEKIPTLIRRADIYNAGGFPISNPRITDGYDEMGYPVSVIVGAVIDDKIILTY